MPTSDDFNIQSLRALIERNRRVVVFTGAGISTESGIPDFRSPGGVWSRLQPIYFQEFVASEAVRREAWRRRFDNSDGWVGAQPNRGHHAVAQLIESGRVQTVITQNVDNLHQLAGVPEEKMIELHGNATYASCLSCQMRVELKVIEQQFVADGTVAPCKHCGGTIKSATISFGQQLPALAMQRALQATLSSDLFIVLGSSLTVFPAADLPRRAKLNDASLVIVNRDATALDSLADLVIRASIGETMGGIVDDAL